MKIRSFAFILTAIMTLTALALAPVCAGESGDWVYMINDDNMTATLRVYNGSDAEVTIPDNIDGYTVTSVGSNTFGSKTALTKITIPDSVTEIGKDAFFGCSSLTDVIFGVGLTEIAEETFYNCASLRSITIPDGVKIIGDNAFRGCSSLEEVTLPGSVTKIGKVAFFECTSLTKFTVPAGVNQIDYDAFTGCASLEAIEVDPANTSYEARDGILYKKGGSKLIFCPAAAKLTNVTVPDSVKVIGPYAFYKCANIKTVTLGKNVNEIYWWSFADCPALKSITIQPGLKTIEINAFKYCSSLEKVYFTGAESDYNIMIGATGNNPFINANKVYNYKPGSVTPGDVDGNGKLNAKDVTAIMKHLVGKTPENFVLEAADYNGDGKVNAKDVTALMKFLVNNG